MARKRLLDAAKILNASASIGKKHIALRQQQWEVYTKTSTLVQSVKDHSDRVTVTANAAYELAKRFNETGPSWRQDFSNQEEHGASNAFDEQRGRGGGLKIAEQERSISRAQSLQRENSGSEPDDGRLASLRKREAQRLSEEQIPSVAADSQSDEWPSTGRDTFDVRADAVSQELSSLPRTKIPKHFEHGVATSEEAEAKEINQEVFYTPNGGGVDGKQLPENATLEGVFSSPRVSQMLGRNDSASANPYAGRQKLPPKPLPEMMEAEKQRKNVQQESRLAKPKPAPGQAQIATASADAETQELAQSVAQDAESLTDLSQSGADSSPSQQAFAMRESRVPSSRFGRLWEYSGLATSMAFGAVGESFRRFAGGGNEGNLMLSEGNMNRLVTKLSRMRGAALKLGQMMSFQDSKLLPPTINAVLQRVQDSADYMPASQRDKVLVQNLGGNWRDLFSSFDEKPFAAASIGQVHKATLASDNTDVAVKVQYPGVRNSIDSDLNNLSLLLTASRLLPKGLYLDKTIANARVELAWECDYEREAEACIRFQELLKDESNMFTVPTIYREASGPGVLTAEFMHGTAVTKMKDLSQQDRDWVGTQILRLCLRELMEWRFMQTDPNWTNFLYNQQSQKLELLDFGASRDFPDKFVEPYVSLLIAASKGDRDRCKDLSIELGYLTGHEGKDMLKAHVDSILTLAEPFVETAPEVYDFEDQTITDRVRSNIGLMLKERLAPPPEETYSLHRKLSGAFLLCARLRSRVKAREMFAKAVEVWHGRQSKVAPVA